MTRQCSSQRSGSQCEVREEFVSDVMNARVFIGADKVEAHNEVASSTSLDPGVRSQLLMDCIARIATTRFSDVLGRLLGPNLDVGSAQSKTICLTT